MKGGFHEDVDYPEWRGENRVPLRFKLTLRQTALHSLWLLPRLALIALSIWYSLYFNMPFGISDQLAVLSQDNTRSNSWCVGAMERLQLFSALVLRDV